MQRYLKECCHRHFVKKILLVCVFERDGERRAVKEGDGGMNPKQTGLRAEPDMGLDLSTLRSGLEWKPRV